MSKNLKPQFTWDNGFATCTITDSKTGKCYVGTAICHPDDEDMMSEKTGTEIAYRRAVIKSLQEYREEIKCELAALNKLYYEMKYSKKFNKNSYENKMLQRHIHLSENNLAAIKDVIATEQENLRQLIQEKENFYTRIRLHRMARAQQSTEFKN